MKREKRLIDLKNVGKAVLRDLYVVGITSIEQLSKWDPTELFLELERKTKAHQNPCVWACLAVVKIG